MKGFKLLVLVTLLLISEIVYAQNFHQGASFSGQSIDLQTFQDSDLTTRKYIATNDVDGDPFLFATYVPAKVYSKSNPKQPTLLELNYNIYAGSMNMKSSKIDEVLLLPKRPDLLIVMEGRTFLFLEFEMRGKKSSYVEIIASYENGDMLALLRTQEVKQSLSISESSYSSPRNPRIKTEETFIFITNKGIAIEVKNNNKRVSKEFSTSLNNRLQEYIKINSIEFENDLTGLIATTKYYSSIRTD
ncbi:hypothetical protein [Nonlabens antarcticus]|uniref:hypothetical protein n=1 Tax=Nonlabens antarcticus TaxID=392714 RepID=UPI0018916382|nr:hypothetical protein [Nonlabens antarcticus]